jgi:hypothetical protein
LDALVSKHLHYKMSEKDVAQRVITLFADYATLLRTNGLSWVIKTQTKTAVQHIVSAIRPYPLQKRIKDDLDFAQSHLRKEWLPFMKHVTSRAEHYDECDEYSASHPTTGSGRSTASAGANLG